MITLQAKAVIADPHFERLHRMSTHLSAPVGRFSHQLAGTDRIRLAVLGDALRALLLGTLLSCWPVWDAHAQTGRSLCDAVAQSAGPGGFGPFDYRSNRDKLAGVESVHFTPQVESLIRGQTGHLGQDIAYTLSVFPNHHRALIAGMRLAEREKVAKPSGMKYSIDCYFERAMGFARDDNVTRLIYASHLSKSSRTQEALGIVDAVVATAEDNAFTHFNAGLLFLEFGAFDKALTQAHRAAELGFGNPALKNRLQAAGKWVEPTPVAADETRPADAAASAAAPASRP